MCLVLNERGMYLNRVFSVEKSSFEMILAATVAFMFLNALLPLNFSSVGAEATEHPFKLIITLDRTTYKVGELVNVTWILINVGEENVTLYNSVDILLDFVVYDANFIRVYRYRSQRGGILGIYPFAPIPPGDKMTLTGSWKQTYDSSGKVRPELWRKEVPPGTYHIAGIFHSSTYNVTLTTSVLRIAII